jgi:ABC-type sugar transport system ATPase subunit
MQRATPLLQLDGITKSFGSVCANRDVSLTLHKGQIHALVGENGAGKTTLMRILYGMVQADSGSIALDGRPVQFASPREALAAGVVMVQQSFALVGQLTVAENVVLGDEPTTRFSLLDKGAAADEVARLVARLGTNRPLFWARARPTSCSQS